MYLCNLTIFLVTQRFADNKSLADQLLPFGVGKRGSFVLGHVDTKEICCLCFVATCVCFWEVGSYPLTFVNVFVTTVQLVWG